MRLRRAPSDVMRSYTQPHRDDARVQAVVDALPPYVESRYKPTGLKRLQVVKLALTVQVHRGIELAAHSQLGSRPSNGERRLAWATTTFLILGVDREFSASSEAFPRDQNPCSHRVQLPHWLLVTLDKIGAVQNPALLQKI